MGEITISELSVLLKIPGSTIRYYEDLGLIHSIGRKGLQRVFSKNVIVTMQLILLGKTAGFRLDELKEMLSIQEQPISKEKLLSKATQIDQQIAELDQLRKGLRHISQCRFDNPLECKKFRKILNLHTL